MGQQKFIQPVYLFAAPFETCTRKPTQIHSAFAPAADTYMQFQSFTGGSQTRR